MIFDWDDFSEENNRLDLLQELKKANPLFRCTLFAVPSLGSWQFWEKVPRWCELAVHGWEHPSPMECHDWSEARMLSLMDTHIVQANFSKGFKAPGWQISDGCYKAISDRGWWLADQHYNDDRRPKDIRVHCLGDAPEGETHWHGHIQNDCGNGLEETFDVVLDKVLKAKQFWWVSEAARRW